MVRLNKSKIRRRYLQGILLRDTLTMRVFKIILLYFSFSSAFWMYIPGMGKILSHCQKLIHLIGPHILWCDNLLATNVYSVSSVNKNMIKPACSYLYGEGSEKKSFSTLDIFSGVYETGKDMGANMLGTTAKLMYTGAKYLHQNGYFKLVVIAQSIITL